MKNALSLTISILATGLSLATPTYAADEASSIATAISGGDASIALRYRYEYVDQDGLDQANASTLKTRITYKTLPYKRLSGTLEFDNNSTVIEDGYNDAAGANPGKAKVVDATYTEVNQAHLDYYTGPADTLVRYGRQRIVLDNQRFVGGVAWRQNEQTYDAVAVVNKSLPDTTVLLANVYNVNTITGDNIDGNDHQILNIKNTHFENLNFTAYAYRLKDQSFDKEDLDTYGIRAYGILPVEDLKILYGAEFATQKIDNIADNEVDYLLLEAGLKVSDVTVKLGFESLGSDDSVVGFSTPLATKHKFNGWADMFLDTPATGLEDTYLSVSTKKFGPKLAVVYHQFDSDEGSTDFGSEVDILVAKKFNKNYSGQLKFAQFSEGDPSGSKYPDTSKVWLQLLAKF